MAQRRMFNSDIVGSDAFTEMPPSTQALYFHLGMRADDDGFVNPKTIMRMVNINEDDLKILCAKKFLLPFKNGVVVVKHWRINNFIRKDRYKETVYTEQKELLFVKQNGAYTLDSSQGVPVLESPWKHDNEAVSSLGQPLVDQRLTQYRLGKVRKGKVKHTTPKRVVEGENKERIESIKAKIGKVKNTTVTDGAVINEVIDLFKVVNPMWEDLFKRPPQRKAIDRMCVKIGVEKVKEIINVLPQTNGTKYFPVITTPVQLQNEIGKLLAHIQKAQSTGKGKTIIEE